MSHWQIVFLVPLLMMAWHQPVLSACPTSADLKTGIRVFYDNGKVEEIYSADGVMAVVAQRWLAGIKLRMMVAWRYRGILTTRLVGDVSVIVFDFERPLKELIPSSPHVAVQVKSTDTVNWLSGDRRVMENSGTLEFGETHKAHVGGCEYSVIPVTYTFDGGSTPLSYDYAPDLMAWLRVTMSEGEEPKSSSTSWATKFQILR
jgi:hypothetical protein